MRSIVVMMAGMAAVGVLVCAQGFAGEVRWGEAVRGLRLGIGIDPAGQVEFHPGEFVGIRVELGPEHKMPLPMDVSYNLDHYCVVHVVTPDGREAVCDPAFDAAVEGDLHEAEGWEKSDETVRELRQLRLSRGHKPWFDAAADQPEVSLRAAGKYRAWMEFRVAADPKMPRNGWHGTVKSGAIEWEVTELPAEKRLPGMTDEQKEMVQSWLAGEHKIPMDWEKIKNDPMVRQITRAANEGLAEKTLEVLKQNKSYECRRDAWNLLCMRAGNTDEGQLGIDGPYLKELAIWEMDLVDGKFGWLGNYGNNNYTPAETLNAIQLYHPQGLVEQVLVYLAFHPEDREIRDRVIAQCRVGAKLYGYPMAYKVLTKLEVLKKGMTLGEAIAVLGAPNEQTKESAVWHWYPPSQPSIDLRPYHWDIFCRLKDGRIVERFELLYR